MIRVSYDYDDDTDDDNDHKNDSYTAAGAAPGSWFLVLGSRPWFWLRILLESSSANSTRIFFCEFY